MENNRTPGKLGDLPSYLPKIIKFYDLKSERLTQLVFILVLAVRCIGSFFIPVELGDDLYTSYNALYKVVYLNLVSRVIIDIVSSIYLYAYISELKGKAYTFKSSMSFFAINLFKITFTCLAYWLGFSVGTLLFIIPGIIFYFMFIFVTCYILDLKLGIREAFSASKFITRKRKWKIFSNIFLFNIMFSLPVLIISASINSIIISTFVAVFLNTIISFMGQRLVAAMYFDLEYGGEAGKA